MTNDVLIPEEVAKQTNEVVLRLEQVKALSIATQESFDFAGGQLRVWSDSEKKIKTIRLEMTRPFNDGIKKINDFFKRGEDACAEAKRLLSQKMAAYSQEQARIRAEQEAKLRDAQRKEAEKLEKKAERLEGSGKIEQAEVARQQAAIASLSQPTINTEVEKPQGIKKSVVWKFEITDENLVPREYCSPDSAKIRLQISSLKENCKIAGVRVYSEEVFSSTGR